MNIFKSPFYTTIIVMIIGILILGWFNWDLISYIVIGPEIRSVPIRANLNQDVGLNTLSTGEGIVRLKPNGGEASNIISNITATVTAYCLTGTMANGEEVYKGAVACPIWLPFGSTIKIGDVTGYTCTDRMHKRYREPDYEGFVEERFDIWMETCDEAMEWGIRTINIQTW